MSSEIEYTNDCPVMLEPEIATGPFRNVRVDGAGDIFVASTEKDITAFDAFLDLGKYPIFFASDTTFSLNVALSIKTSFATMLALYDEIYVLYASISSIVDMFDPSKS